MEQRAKEALQFVASAAEKWATRNVSFSLLLAVLTEVPRWTFAFRAINEPLWAGIPLAILIAFATAHAWEEFFQEHDLLLLVLNATSLVFAVTTIAPVLYAMTDRAAHAVNIAEIFSPLPRAIWATILACTTFLPLIQLAVVEARRAERNNETRMLRVLPQQPKATPSAPQLPEPATLPIAQQGNKKTTTKGKPTRGDLIAQAQRLRDGGATCEEAGIVVQRSAGWVSRNTKG